MAVCFKKNLLFFPKESVLEQSQMSLLQKVAPDANRVKQFLSRLTKTVDHDGIIPSFEKNPTVPGTKLQFRSLCGFLFFFFRDCRAGSGRLMARTRLWALAAATTAGAAVAAGAASGTCFLSGATRPALQPRGACGTALLVADALPRELLPPGAKPPRFVPSYQWQVPAARACV